MTLTTKKFTLKTYLYPLPTSTLDLASIHLRLWTLTSYISPEGQIYKAANKCNSSHRSRTAMQLSVHKIHTLKCPKNTAPANAFALRALKLFFGLFENSYHFVSFVPMVHLNSPPFTGIKYALLRDNKRTLKSKYTTLLCMCVRIHIYVCACVRFK